jgi:hypothetical protein
MAGTEPHRAPAIPALREMLEMMLGRGVTVTDAGWAPPAGAVPVAVGVYVDDAEALAGCAWVDLPLAAAMGAAMSMVPKARVEECVQTGEVVPDFQENLHEVLNIASALLNTEDSGHVRIRTLELLAAGLSEDTLTLLADPRAAGYYRVSVEEYGDGLMSFTLA